MRIAERDDELAGGVGSQTRGIGESHDVAVSPPLGIDGNGFLVGDRCSGKRLGESDSQGHVQGNDAGAHYPEVLVKILELPGDVGLGFGETFVESGDVALELGSQLGDVALEFGSQLGDVVLEFGSQLGDVALEFGSYLGGVGLGGDIAGEAAEVSVHDGFGQRLVGSGVLKSLDGVVGIEKNRGHERDDAPRTSWSSIGKRVVDFAVVLGKALRSAAGAVVVGGGVLAWWSGAFAQEAPEDACPRAALRQMMSTAAAHDAVGDVASIELEVLRLCTQRQDLIVKVAEGEARLAELRGVVPAGTVAASVAAMRAPVEVLPAPAKASALADARREDPVMKFAPPPRAETARVVVRPAPRQELRWTTVYGSAGDWTARVTDGVKVWYVRPGDGLPLGFKVVSVRVRPPGVEVGRNGTAWQLPGPDG